MNKGLIFWTILISTSLEAFSKSDTLFWFVAPEVENNGYDFDRPVVLRISTLDVGASVTIDFPAASSLTPISVNIPANTLQSIDLTHIIDDIENKPANAILNKGIRIRSNNFIRVYYEVVSSSPSFCTNCNTDIFVLKGQDALGLKFLVPFQTSYNNGSVGPHSSFDIVATEDNTLITITPTQDLAGRLKNIPFSITLNKGQTYSAVSSSKSGTLRPSGSSIVSNKPVAVTFKDDHIQISSCQDLGGDQLVPEEKTGKDYIIIKGELSSNDRYTVLAIENNTQVFVNGFMVTTLNRGQTYTNSLSAASVRINSSKNFYLIQLSGFGCESALALVPSLSASCSDRFWFSRASTDPLYVLICVRAGGESTFLVNNSSGIINTSDFQDVPFTNGEWKYAKKLLNLSIIPLNFPSSISNTFGNFTLGILQGKNIAGGARFAYFSDFNFSREMETKLASVCIGDSLKLKSTFLFDVNTDEWKGPNGFSSKLAQPTLAFSDFNMSGKYYISSTSAGCSSFSDTIQVSVSPLPPPPSPLVANSPICIGDTLLIFAGTQNLLYTTVWTKDNDTIVTSPFNLLIPSASLADMGTYFAQNFNLATGCYSTKDSILINVSGPSPKPSILAEKDSLCENQSLVLKHNLNLATSDSLFWISPSSTFYTDSLVLPSVSVSDNGLYVLHYFQEGTCAPGLDSFWLRVFQDPDISSAAILSNSPLCEGKEALVYVEPTNPFYTYSWRGPNGFTHLGPSVSIPNAQLAFAGQYSLTVANGPCVFVDTLLSYLSVHTMPIANFNFSASYASVGVAFDFVNTSAKANSFIWNFGDMTPPSTLQNPSHTYLTEANRIVILIAVNDSQTCMDTIQKPLWVFNEEQILVPSSFSPNQDGYNEEFTLYITGVKEYRMEVYNRWGEKIFDSEIEKKLSWDGTYAGKPCQQDVYVVLLYYTDRLNKRNMTKKTVQLLR